MKRIAVVAVGLITLGLFLAGCGEKYTEGWRDARRGATNGGPADLVTFPDGFNNVATKCDHGNRVYVTYHGDQPYGSITVVPNAEGC